MNSFKLSFSDYSFAVMSDKKRCLDFVFVAKLKKKMTAHELQDGASLSFKQFPKSDCYIVGKRWVKTSDAYTIDQKIISNSNADEINLNIMQYISTYMNIEKTRSIRQLLITSDKGQFLVTRMHHALGDGMSCFMWLSTQLRINLLDKSEMILKRHNKPKTKSIFAFESPSEIFKGISDNENLKERSISNVRAWKTYSISKETCFPARQDFSYNDYLSAAFMETLKRFKLKPIGLYIPVNIRKDPFTGFGNGSSRIKIYDNQDTRLTLIQRSKHIRQQVKWCLKNGMWATPIKLGLFNILPKFINKKILRIISNKADTDFSCFIFSHIERLGIYNELFSLIEEGYFISQLYHPYSMAIVGITQDNITKITFTWDQEQLGQTEVDDFFGIFKEVLSEKI